jgi:hypothetical protein
MIPFKLLLQITIGSFFLISCNSMEKYKKDLYSDNINLIDRACYELGEAKDTSAVKPLLISALDPRTSTNLYFKGMTVNYCRLVALKKISGVDIGRKMDQFAVDTAATNFYLNWAVKQGYLKDKKEIDINYYK